MEFFTFVLELIDFYLLSWYLCKIHYNPRG